MAVSGGVEEIMGILLITALAISAMIAVLLQADAARYRRESFKPRSKKKRRKG